MWRLGLYSTFGFFVGALIHNNHRQIIGSGSALLGLLGGALLSWWLKKS